MFFVRVCEVYLKKVIFYIVDVCLDVDRYDFECQWECVFGGSFLVVCKYVCVGLFVFLKFSESGDLIIEEICK